MNAAKNRVIFKRLIQHIPDVCSHHLVLHSKRKNHYSKSIQLFNYFNCQQSKLKRLSPAPPLKTKYRSCTPLTLFTLQDRVFQV